MSPEISDAPKKVRHYREIGQARIGAPDELRGLAEAALAALMRSGRRVHSEINDESECELEYRENEGHYLVVRYAGEALPATIPGELIRPADVGCDPRWRPAHRLTVFAPLRVLDIAWRGDEPLRIFTFSRGDWEQDLLASGA